MDRTDVGLVLVVVVRQGLIERRSAFKRFFSGILNSSTKGPKSGISTRHIFSVGNRVWNLFLNRLVSWISRMYRILNTNTIGHITRRDNWEMGSWCYWINNSLLTASVGLIWPVHNRGRLLGVSWDRFRRIMRLWGNDLTRSYNNWKIKILLSRVHISDKLTSLIQSSSMEMLLFETCLWKPSKI